MTPEEIVQMIRDEAAYWKPYCVDMSLTVSGRMYSKGKYDGLKLVAARIERLIADSKRAMAVQGEM